ncbi:MAG TPA: DUF1475 family protein [Acidimicrobiia bacterium]|nr:DUF1475 family protein [Acidimicrobiia bacterium]
MRTIRALSILGLVVMIAVIIYWLVSGDFFEEGSSIWSLTWGRVTLVDLYVGLIFFAAWIAQREKSPVVVAVWRLALVVLGNLAAAVYLVRASFSSIGIGEPLLGSEATR